METIIGLVPPEPGEYNSFYKKYVDLVAEAAIPEHMEIQEKYMASLFGGLEKSKHSLSYGPEKWNFKQVLGHIVDTEKIMHFRALCICRGEMADFPGFDQEAYVKSAFFDQMEMEAILDAFIIHRQSFKHFMKAVPEGSWLNTGTVRGHPMSVRALVYISLGHLEHHIQLLNEKYVPLI
ncbi:MAG: DinB family protein [Cyclobacteriaceae bacterium]